MVKMAVAVGGSFTDAVWLDTDRNLETLKSPPPRATRHKAPSPH